MPSMLSPSLCLVELHKGWEGYQKGHPPARACYLPDSQHPLFSCSPNKRKSHHTQGLITYTGLPQSCEAQICPKPAAKARQPHDVPMSCRRRLLKKAQQTQSLPGSTPMSLTHPRPAREISEPCSQAHSFVLDNLPSSGLC